MRNIKDSIIEKETANKVVDCFWKSGEISLPLKKIVLRPVDECDREKFIELQKENAIMPEMFKKEKFKDYLWQEHTNETALIGSILLGNEYVGYCGIKDVTHDRWEITIEILKKWQHKGIGFITISILLEAIKVRLGITEFRIRIAAENYTSQRLFEKLGAKPNGISEFLLHGEEIVKVEEENLHLIDDKMITLAEKFKVEPRKLLSHVLEYKLVWDKENRMTAVRFVD